MLDQIKGKILRFRHLSQRQVILDRLELKRKVRGAGRDNKSDRSMALFNDLIYFLFSDNIHKDLRENQLLRKKQKQV